MPSERLVLGFDTSAAHCAAALVLGERVLAHRVEAMAKGQAERLLPMLEEVMAEAGRGWGELDAVAVCTGPGNFTGIRIGVAASRGLALALGVPAVGLTQFEIRSHFCPREQYFTTRVAGRRYGQMMRAGMPIGAAQPLPEDDGVIGGMPANDGGVGGRGGEIDEGAMPIDPRRLARCAAERLASGAVDPAARPVPFYLREPDARPSAEAPPVLLDE